MSEINNVDYTAIEIFDSRSYDDFPYLVLPKEIFRLSLNWDIATSIRAYVYRRSELFGEPVPLNLAGFDISFNLYNSDNVLVSAGKGTVSDLDTSEIEYVIEDLDIKDWGRYYGYFILTDIDGKSVMLPNPRQKQRIVINVSQ